jgi:hypothetical protein
MGEILGSDRVKFNPVKYSCKFGHKIGSSLSDKFELRVVSINETFLSENEKHNVVLNGVHGSYGHVFLEYKSHGTLIFSAANFSELQEVNVNIETLWASIEKRKGSEYLAKVNEAYKSGENKEETLRQIVVDYLKALLPC